WLTPMTESFRLAAYCVTEPDAGSDVAGMRTVAKRDGDFYVLNGSKMWITNGGVADWYFVVAYTDPSKKHDGMSAFIVPRDTTGIEVGKKGQNMGQRASDTRAVTFRDGRVAVETRGPRAGRRRAVTFRDVRVPVENRVGEEGSGWRLAMGAFDRTRPVVSAAAVGVARAALEHAVRYSMERSTFGRPIAQHQAIAFMIAEMGRDVEAARLLVWKAAWLIDRGERNTLEAAYAKLFAADTVMRVTTDAVQIFGGYGY